jgi:hypothetical protein
MCALQDVQTMRLPIKRPPGDQRRYETEIAVTNYYPDYQVDEQCGLQAAQKSSEPRRARNRRARHTSEYVVATTERNKDMSFFSSLLA